MTDKRQPFQFGQDPTIRSMQADKEMLEYILKHLTPNHVSREAVEQDLGNLKHQLDEAQKNARNNSTGN